MLSFLSGPFRLPGTRRLANEALQAVAELELRSGRLRALAEQLAAQARRSYAQAAADAAARREATTPVDELALHGARVGPLKAAGLLTLAHLAAHSPASLERLPGVGPATVEAALQALLAYRKEALARARVRPDPDNPSAADLDLLVAVARLELVQRRSPAAIQAADAARAALDEGARWIFGELGSGLLFDGDRQLRLRGYVRQFLPVARAAAAAAEADLLRLLDPPECAPEAVRRRYADNTAWFFALAEALRPPPPPGLVTELPEASGDAAHGLLPREIARQVEATELRRGSLGATLRRYQVFGAQYLVARRRALLGDDMGLGKTMQVLAALCHLHETGRRHFLVVAPNSVVSNWEREVRRHTGLRPQVVHGHDRLDELEAWRREGGVAITTFGTIGALAPHVGDLDFLAVDEAHAVKNPEARRTRAIQALARQASHVALLSGTALENRLAEFHALVVLAAPDMAAAAKPLLALRPPPPDEARRLLAPAYLRRTQDEVLTELPELTRIDELVPLTDEERAVPESLRTDLMGLRLAASVGLGPRSAKVLRLAELLETYRAEGRKVAVFSFFRRVLDEVVALAGDAHVITGDQSSAERLAAIDAFAAREGHAVIALQIEAGGQGINLQAAQVVVLMEPQLKPSTENQAVARVRRMGQSRAVTVHRLIAEGTVDEWLVDLIAEKQALFDAYAHRSSVAHASDAARDAAAALETPEAQAELAAALARRLGEGGSAEPRNR